MAGETPIGTIVAHGGGDFTPENEEHSGWLLCDGRVFSVSEQPNLFDAIGFTWGGDGSSSFNLPDLGGYFLRGFDARERVAPDGDRRTENNPGGATGNAVGTVQDFATAQPQDSAFVAQPDGAHDHPMNFQTNATRDVDDQSNTVAFPAPNPSKLTWPRTAAEGPHEHRIIGGNVETRPVNANVNWIIRAR
jgi:microcystin-dependent protein